MFVGHEFSEFLCHSPARHLPWDLSKALESCFRHQDENLPRLGLPGFSSTTSHGTMFSCSSCSRRHPIPQVSTLAARRLRHLLKCKMRSSWNTTSTLTDDNSGELMTPERRAFVGSILLFHFLLLLLGLCSYREDSGQSLAAKRVRG